MAESTYQHLIALNNDKGKASFYDPPKKPLNRQLPFGSLTTIYSNPTLPPDASFKVQSDLDLTAEHSQTGIGARICPDGGFANTIITLPPGAVTPMHRTRTVDLGVVIEGEVEVHLDNDEVRTLKQGDTIVMRGAMHQWVNASQKDVKMFAVIIDAKPIIAANGKEMGEEWL